MAGALVLLTPLGSLVALAALVSLAGLAVAARRERRARDILRLPPPPPARRLPRVLGLVAVSGLLGLAATQPAWRTTDHAHVRTDAQALFVIDVSRSMRAARGPSQPTRLARAKSEAITLREAIPEVPSGVATLTDRVLPDLLPSPDRALFRSTVEQAVSIESPPPGTTAVLATSLQAIGAVGTQNFFPPTATHRLVVVLTDGESTPVDPQQVARMLAAGPGVRIVLVHVWASGEQVSTGGRAETAYREDPQSGRTLESLAQAAGGSAFGERELGAAARAAVSALGSGPTDVEGTTQHVRALAPYAAAAAILPLLLLIGPGLVHTLGRSRRVRATVPSLGTGP